VLDDLEVLFTEKISESFMSLLIF